MKIALEPLMQAETRARESLKEITDLALEFGRLSMEAGASAHHAEDIAARVALGLGAERVDMSIGYCSLAVTISFGHEAITRICKVGPVGVNERLHGALSAAAARIERCEMTVTTLVLSSRQRCAIVLVMPIGSSPSGSASRAPRLVG
jgi:hypothetical protein